ncbi:MAG TPA: response regulator [Flavisolibacter sp.]|nr:response regulator [Flavisolibacter sp.]
MSVDAHLTNQQAIKSIILADDDIDDHDFFREALNEIAPSIKLTIVNNGDELLNLLNHYIPDFIFLDLDMPCKNGLQCLTEIRANQQIKSIPVVIFSSTSRPANIETAYEMGADLFFIKPSVYNELISSIKAILELNWQNPSRVKEEYFINGRYVAFM